MAFLNFQGVGGELNGHPFYSVRFGPEAARALREALLEHASRDRAWMTLVATAESPSRVRVKEDSTAAFELRAAPLYVRGDVLRVSGREGKSCNITMSSAGAGELARKLGEAEARMREWVELRVASRKRALVEIRPDTDLAGADDPELDALARSSASLAAATLPREDFSDWED